MKATSVDHNSRDEHGKMKAVSDGIYRRGKHGNMYVQRRIPAAIRAAYPSNQTHVIRSLGTSDTLALECGILPRYAGPKTHRSC